MRTASVVRVLGCRSRDPGFDSRRYEIFWEVVGLERGRLSLMSTTEELPGRNSSGFGLENREYGRGDLLRWPRDTLYPQKLALTSPTSGSRSVGTVCLQTKTTDFVCLFLYMLLVWLLLIILDGVKTYPLKTTVNTRNLIANIISYCWGYYS
jgi:hypothetical protein